MMAQLLRILLCLPAAVVFTAAERITQKQDLQAADESGGVKSAARTKRFAFVTMAFDPPGEPFGQLWGAVAMAHAIKEHSAYPLVVLTNTTHFPDGQAAEEVLGRLGAVVRPARDVDVNLSAHHDWHHFPCSRRVPPTCRYHFLKLQIWSLTEYDKLIWLDSDSLVTSSMDFLFDYPGTWSQPDNWLCTASKDVCSGLLVLEPSRSTYECMVQYASQHETPGGDQRVIQGFFKNALKEPIQLLDLTVASFGQCLDKMHTTPAFVHKSDQENKCFQAHALASDCKSDLGVAWRRHFCQAVKQAQLSEVESCREDFRKPADGRGNGVSQGWKHNMSSASL